MCVISDRMGIERRLLCAEYIAICVLRIPECTYAYIQHSIARARIYKRISVQSQSENSVQYLKLTFLTRNTRIVFSPSNSFIWVFDGCFHFLHSNTLHLLYAMENENEIEINNEFRFLWCFLFYFMESIDEQRRPVNLFRRGSAANIYIYIVCFWFVYKNVKCMRN